MIAKKEATDLNHDDDISSRANVEIYRNFRPISLCESKSRLRRHLAELNFDARQQQLL